MIRSLIVAHVIWFVLLFAWLLFVGSEDVYCHVTGHPYAPISGSC